MPTDWYIMPKYNRKKKLKKYFMCVVHDLESDSHKVEIINSFSDILKKLSKL